MQSSGYPYVHIFYNSAQVFQVKFQENSFKKEIMYATEIIANLGIILVGQVTEFTVPTFFEGE